MAEITFLEALRQGIWEEMERDSSVFCIGEDVGVYGGAFKITEGFIHRFGIEFEAHQFFAGRQIFHRHIHRQTFPSELVQETPSRPVQMGFNFAKQRAGKGRKAKGERQASSKQKRHSVLRF